MSVDNESAPRIPDPEVVPTMELWPDVGRLLGLGRTATYDRANDGSIPTVRLGRRFVVPTAALRRLLGLDAASAVRDLERVP